MSSPGRRQVSPIRTALAQTPTKTSPNSGPPSGLEKPLTQLSDNMQKTMAAFYDVHKGLLVSKRASSVAIDQFKHTKHIFRAELETLRQVLQNAYRHSIDFSASCQRAPNDRYMSAKRCQGSGRAVLRDLQDINKAYDRNLEAFKTQRAILTGFLSEKSKGGDRRPASYNPDASGTSPDSAVTVLFKAVEDVQTSLRNILAFWDNHAAFLTLVVNRQTNFPSPGQETKATVEMWTRYQTALLQCSGSIAQTADAMSVDPSVVVLNGKPHRRQTYPYTEAEGRQARQQAEQMNGRPFESDKQHTSSGWFCGVFSAFFR
ncbi:hypothetical protein CPC08DRAFT_765553 [Agrocybe pediades]|nr:hypothetical protein CPC08DRAFT_765553 [Agrocybe pediades]